MEIFPLGAGLVSTTFAVSLFRQFDRRRRPQHLAWALAMVAFAVASLSAWAGVMGGWTEAYFRSYYLFGAILNVPILALGTVYLHLPRRVGHVAALAVAAASVVAVAAVWTAPLQSSVNGLRGAIPAGSEVMPPGLRLLSRYYSYTGFVVVLAGAVGSAIRLSQRREARLRRLARGNALIAVGTVIVALGSAFARQGSGSIFAVALAAGVSVMFAGFLQTLSIPSEARGAAAELASDGLGKAAG